MEPVAVRARAGGLWRFDEAIASVALVLMALIPLIEIVSRPFMGKGIENSAALTQHLGLVLAMFGAVAAERYGHLTTLGSGVGALGSVRWQQSAHVFANASAAQWQAATPWPMAFRYGGCKRPCPSGLACWRSRSVRAVHRPAG